MFGIKRLDGFMLKSFLPLFMMTFVICLFIVLMQFLWSHIDELVGKGLGVDVIAELFFYAAMSMVPLALPLSILLAALMTFGNLGERFELTAIKASGVSLVRAMRPLTVLIVFVSIGAFFFQNYVLPVAQTKMWTLIFSVRQKSPELEIPEGVFYDQIPGYNLFVDHKNRKTGMLYDMMIYDVSEGFDNARVILADSGRLAVTEDQTHLFLKLWDGEMFENLREQGAANVKNVPYRRESFLDKEIMIKFDANFNRMDEEGIRNQYVGKNMAELIESIDSLQTHADSLGLVYGSEIMLQPMFGIARTTVDDRPGSKPQPYHEVAMPARPIDVDSILRGSNSGVTVSVLNLALNNARRNRQEFEYKSFSLVDDQKLVRRHNIELQKKFTLSFACLIFFFIGAPLGSIIRKGGLGMPLVISVFLFIFYYIIDNSGYKLARDGKWAVWQGIWLSSAVLLPMGIFFTYKAVNDSAVFNRDAYANFFRKLFGRNEKRSVEMKAIVMDEVVASTALSRLGELRSDAAGFLASMGPSMPSYKAYWLDGIDRHRLHNLSARLEQTVDYLNNSRDRNVILKITELPILRSLWVYHPTNYCWVAYAAMILFPVGLTVYLFGRKELGVLRGEISTIVTVSDELTAIYNSKLSSD